MKAEKIKCNSRLGKWNASIGKREGCNNLAMYFSWDFDKKEEQHYCKTCWLKSLRNPEIYGGGK